MESISTFLISFLSPVSEHCAQTVSIATALEDLILKGGGMRDGGGSGGDVGGLGEDVKIQEWVLSVIQYRFVKE